VQRLGELQTALATHLATLGTALEAPMTRLMQTAAEVPQAAAGVITQLRAELSHITERDTLALQERTAVMEQVNTLLQALQRSAGDQRAAIEALATSAATVMDQASQQFADTLGVQAVRAEAVAAQVAGSAVDLSALGEVLPPRRDAFQRQQSEADGQPAAHRRHAGPLDGAQRRAAGLLRGTGARGDRPQHQLAAGRDRRPAAAPQAAAGPG
jgi:hypothetical protein